MADKWGNVRINVKEDTRSELDRLKESERDTHNNVIERLIYNGRKTE